MTPLQAAIYRGVAILLAFAVATLIILYVPDASLKVAAVGLETTAILSAEEYLKGQAENPPVLVAGVTPLPPAPALPTNTVLLDVEKFAAILLQANAAAATPAAPAPVTNTTAPTLSPLQVPLGTPTPPVPPAAS